MECPGNSDINRNNMVSWGVFCCKPGLMVTYNRKVTGLYIIRFCFVMALSLPLPHCFANIPIVNLKKNSQPESWELNFIWSKIRTKPGR